MHIQILSKKTITCIGIQLASLEISRNSFLTAAVGLHLPLATLLKWTPKQIF